MRKARFLFALILLAGGGFLLMRASDHSDFPVAGGVSRVDANISDVHAFVSGSNLVLAVSTNTGIPPSAGSYLFPSDVTFEINLDVDARVDTSSDPLGDGGVLLDPQRINEDVTFRVRFLSDGSARVQRIQRGANRDDAQIVNFFAGLRDDPFIRIPRDRRNVGAIVIETPLSSIVEQQSTLLIWATAKVEEFDGPHQEITGRSLRSMFPEQAALNPLHPKQHLSKTGLRTDVMIYDTSRPAAFPNGRSLTDDVLLLACQLSNECRVFNSEMRPMTPRSNDRPYLSTFPYLAEPHPVP